MRIGESQEEDLYISFCLVDMDCSLVMVDMEGISVLVIDCFRCIGLLCLAMKRIHQQLNRNRKQTTTIPIFLNLTNPTNPNHYHHSPRRRFPYRSFFY